MYDMIGCSLSVKIAAVWQYKIFAMISRVRLDPVGGKSKNKESMLNVNESLQIHFFTLNDSTFLYINLYEAEVFSCKWCVYELTHTHRILYTHSHTQIMANIYWFQRVI